jgi:hypothetical protein
VTNQQHDATVNWMRTDRTVNRGGEIFIKIFRIQNLLSDWGILLYVHNSPKNHKQKS